ncbi:ribosome-associated translation inhibitor RaiA [Gordonia sp. TBRC 11910]|uniref:Ribosome hibernation promoting factor n=1 Tax=Gordonia asplenii TaxID=2725283 RepID=A0A848KPN7_9ACTN|nr:ribosome-associated translation inhibitor RaiA [Gordonia asplenii]NMO00202.1 ribosome-associated translation inhibitor RaiA [Gordonia asplenii]
MSTVIHRKGHRESKVAEPRPNEAEVVANAFVRPPGLVESEDPAQPDAKVTFNGRNVEIPEHYRIHVSDKLARLERYDSKISRFDVVLYHERNPRQAKASQQVEITVTGKGPVVRAQACGENFYSSLEAALDKVDARLRRVKTRREVHYGNRTPKSVAEATGTLPDDLTALAATNGNAAVQTEWDDGVTEHTPGQVVRIKEHPDTPMTVDDALYEMELVGHDFFLFHDKETDKPSVVYRRHAFDYGLIRLS